MKKRTKDIYTDTVKFNIRMGVGSSAPTSITLRKNIIALWILLMDKADRDPYELIQEFIEKVCLKRWKKESGKGLSDFVTKCMIHSFLESDDFQLYKKIYLSL